MDICACYSLFLTIQYKQIYLFFAFLGELKHSDIFEKNPYTNFTEFFSLSKMLLKCPGKEAGF